MTNDKQQRTELSDLGEFRLIDRLTANIKTYHPETIKGIGDDAAVFEYGEKYLLLSTDVLVEGIHFDLMYTPLRHLGYKAAVVNISDIAAMNGIPKQLTVNLSVSNRFSVEALEELYQGIKLACEKYQVDIVGGDTTSSKSGLYISISVTGIVDKEKVTYRNKAGEKDLLCVSGDLGAAYMGLMLLEREKAVFKNNPKIQPDLEGHDYILSRQLKPEARIDIVKLLEEKEILPSSMIDISDGLASEILHICRQSNCGCQLYEKKIPIDFTVGELAKDFNTEPLIAALNGGEDYELLFTVPIADHEKINNIPEIRIIGYITDESEGCHLITNANQAIPLEAQGWDAHRIKE